MGMIGWQGQAGNKPVAMLAGWAAVLLLAGCGEAYEPEELKANRNEIATVSVPAWPGNEAVATGRWTPDNPASPAALSFILDPATPPAFRLACDDRGGILLERLGVPAVGATRMMEVNAGGELARLAVNEPQGEPEVLRAAIPFNHSLMAALAKPRGQLSVRAGDAQPLTMPLTPETAALAATCSKPAAEAAG